MQPSQLTRDPRLTPEIWWKISTAINPDYAKVFGRIDQARNRPWCKTAQEADRLWDLGDKMIALRNYQKAENYLAKAFEAEPNGIYSFRKYAAAMQVMGNHEKAAGLLKMANIFQSQLERLYPREY